MNRQQGRALGHRTLRTTARWMDRQPGCAGYLRLRVFHRDGDAVAPGIFCAMDMVEELGDLSRADAARLEEMLDWFNHNLTAPHDNDVPEQAVFWLKAGAAEYRARLWELGNFVRQQGLLIEWLGSRRPGSIVYEDRLQVAAIPYRNR